MIKIDTQDLIDIIDTQKYKIKWENGVTNMSYILSKGKLCKEMYFNNF